MADLQGNCLVEDFSIMAHFPISLNVSSRLLHFLMIRMMIFSMIVSRMEIRIELASGKWNEKFSRSMWMSPGVKWDANFCGQEDQPADQEKNDSPEH